MEDKVDSVFEQANELADDDMPPLDYTDRPGGEPGTTMLRWADAAMRPAEPMRVEVEGLPSVKLLSMNHDPLGSIGAMARMYEGIPTYNLEDIIDDERLYYFEAIRKTRLRAPFESVVLHFFIEGVDRTFTHQIVRQRTAAYAQESLRFAVKEEMSDVIIPPSVRSLKEDDPLRVIWDGALDDIYKAYLGLINSGIPAEEARGLLPHCVSTRIHYVTNLRNLVEHAGNRLCTQAQFHWKLVFSQIVKAIRMYPFEGGKHHVRLQDNWQFEYIADSELFRPVCFEHGKCPFDSVLDRACSIRERANAGQFDLIDPVEWLANPGAARS